MRERQRPDRSRTGSPGPEADDQGSSGLSEIKLKGEDYLHNAEDVIKMALSGDSSAFLAQSRQQGGE
jgi:hypothetical protein